MKESSGAGVRGRGKSGLPLEQGARCEACDQSARQMLK